MQSNPTTPLEIAEYKQRWMMQGGYPVSLHSDLDWKGKTWCRKNIERYQWSFSPWTDVYEHTFWFENLDIAEQFYNEVKG